MRDLNRTLNQLIAPVGYTDFARALVGFTDDRLMREIRNKEYAIKVTKKSMTYRENQRDETYMAKCRRDIAASEHVLEAAYAELDRRTR